MTLSKLEQYAIDAFAREYVREQSVGEWSDEQITKDAETLAACIKELFGLMTKTITVSPPVAPIWPPTSPYTPYIGDPPYMINGEPLAPLIPYYQHFPNTGDLLPQFGHSVCDTETKCNVINTTIDALVPDTAEILRRIHGIAQDRPKSVLDDLPLIETDDQSLTYEHMEPLLSARARMEIEGISARMQRDQEAKSDGETLAEHFFGQGDADREGVE